MQATVMRELPQAEWLDVIGREYLAGFIPGGGAAVKFVIACPDRIPEIAGRFGEQAARSGLEVFHLSAATMRVHMLHEVFFAIARQLSWAPIVQGQVERLFAAHGYAWPRPGEPVALAELAATAGVAPALMERNRDQWLSEEIWADAALTQDFRSALWRLCLGRLDPAEEGASQPVMQWLRGELSAIGALREAQIFTRINRNNARAMLASLCRWLRRAGRGGIAVTLDLSQLLRAGPVADGDVHYTPAAVMDAYEVLRELIDDIDRLPGLFLLVLADGGLTAGDRRRVLDQYSALQMRIWPDVRPGGRQNPVAPLVWVGA
jgi:hypothetical protein